MREVLEELEVMRRVRLCTLEVVQGELSFGVSRFPFFVQLDRSFSLAQSFTTRSFLP